MKTINDKKFIVTCDSACDMPKEFIDSLGAYVIPFEYTGKVGNDVELYTDTMNANDYNILTENVKKMKPLLCSGHFTIQAIKKALDLLNRN